MRSKQLHRTNQLSSLKKVIPPQDLRSSPTISEGSLKPFSPQLLSNSFKHYDLKIKPFSTGSPPIMSANQSIYIEKRSKCPVKTLENIERERVERLERNQRILSNSGFQMSDAFSSYLRPRAASGNYTAESSLQSIHMRPSDNFEFNRLRPSIYNFEDSTDNSPTSKYKTPERIREGSLSR